MRIWQFPALMSNNLLGLVKGRIKASKQRMRFHIKSNGKEKIYICVCSMNLDKQTGKDWNKISNMGPMIAYQNETVLLSVKGQMKWIFLASSYCGIRKKNSTKLFFHFANIFQEKRG